MTIPADQATILLAIVGNPNSTLATGSPSPLDLFWDRAVQYGTIHPRLQFLYTQRDALDMRLAEESLNTDLNVEGEISDSQSQRFNHLFQMKQDVIAEINRMTQVSRGTGVGASASGAITKTTPESPCFPDAPDPNGDWARGSAFSRGPRGWW